MINVNELICLSAIIAGEAGGEVMPGQKYSLGHLAVAYSAINRQADPKYPKTICGVMNQPYQYEFLKKNGMPPKKQIDYFMPLAKAIMEGKVDDPTNGAKWFHAKWMKPYWAKDKEVKLTYMNHIFY
jgi:spore germination cell wall hydrolase CwlJ-like protein